MGRKFTLSTPRKNGERKRQEMKIKRVGRPSKVNSVEMRGSQQQVQRAPLVQAPLVQAPQVLAPQIQASRVQAP